MGKKNKISPYLNGGSSSKGKKRTERKEALAEGKRGGEKATTSSYSLIIKKGALGDESPGGPLLLGGPQKTDGFLQGDHIAHA